MRKHLCECHACKYRRWYYSKQGEKPKPDYKRCTCRLCLKYALRAANRRNQALRAEVKELLNIIERQRTELRCHHKTKREISRAV